MDTKAKPERPLVLYLHGFLSSPQSKKAQQVQSYCNEHGIGESLHIPQLGFSPRAMMSDIEAFVMENLVERDVALIGSSLGGYYACYLAERFNLRAALINPAVGPLESWRSRVGRHKNYYSNEVHDVTAQHIDELLEMNVVSLKNPKNYLVMVQKGDETLDYRIAAAKYRDANCVIEENGSHAFEGFDRQIPHIIEFLTLQK